MSKKKKSKEVVETTEDQNNTLEVNSEDQVEETIDTTEGIAEDLNGETFTEDESAETVEVEEKEETVEPSEEAVAETTSEEEVVETTEAYTPQEDTSVKETIIEKPVKGSNDQNLSVMLNGYPVAKSFVLDQIANNHTIKILEVRPNAYISYAIGGKK